MKMDKSEYFELSYYQALAEKQQVSIEGELKEKENKTLKKRIHDLEALVINEKIGLLKQKKRNFQDKVLEVRKRIAERLDINLDKYILDDESLELIHEDKVAKL